MKDVLFIGFAVVCVGILCALGAWQVQRLGWKADIIERMEQAYAQKPTPALTRHSLAELAQEEVPLAYGRAQGQLEEHKAVFIGTPVHDGKPGYHALVPLRLDTGGTLLVNFGWTEDREINVPTGSVWVEGVARKPDWSKMASENAPRADQWFRADVKEIAAARHLGEVSPLILYAVDANFTPRGIVLHPPGWLPRNKHLQYALFWFGMAGVAAFVFALSALNLRRDRTEPEFD